MKRSLDIIQCTLGLVAVFLVTACNNQWNDHIAVNSSTLDSSVLDIIKADQNFSAFYGLLQETGYDTVLQEGYEYTILVPDNEAVAAFISANHTTDMDIQEKRAIDSLVVKNHIAFGSYNSQVLMRDGRLKMINGKNLVMDNLVFNNNYSNVLCSNGILHLVNEVIKPMMNIDEYLQSLPEEVYMQKDSLYAKASKVMDMDKSIQKGVDAQGRPIYDTVWVTRNYFFEEMPLNDEDSTYTFVLLDDENFREIKQKYAKYMNLGDEELTDSLVTDELIRDLVFQGGMTAEGGMMTAVSGVKVDFSEAILDTDYKASNGVVRIMRGVQIWMKDKLQDVYVEGEDYAAAHTEKQVFTRVRNWARGGLDVMVSAQTCQIDPLTGKKYWFYGNQSNINKNTNFYLKYNVLLNSTTYDVYWVSYDDMEEHVRVDGDDVPAATLKVCQKLFASMPGKKELSVSSNVVKNNEWGDQEAFVSYSYAGGEGPEEVRLQRYSLGLSTSSSTPNYQRPIAKVEGKEAYDFVVPQMGTTVLMVCNSAGFGEEYDSVSDKDKGSGVMFLDYIKFVPRIAEGD